MTQLFPSSNLSSKVKLKGKRTRQLSSDIILAFECEFHTSFRHSFINEKIVWSETLLLISQQGSNTDRDTEAIMINKYKQHGSTYSNDLLIQSLKVTFSSPF